MYGIPVHQLFSLTPSGLFVSVHAGFGTSLALKEALCIFGSVEAGLLSGGIDFIAERM
jgi:hypothetical protein